MISLAPEKEWLKQCVHCGEKYQEVSGKLIDEVLEVPKLSWFTVDVLNVSVIFFNIPLGQKKYQIVPVIWLDPNDLTVVVVWHPTVVLVRLSII